MIWRPGLRCPRPGRIRCLDVHRRAEGLARCGQVELDEFRAAGDAERTRLKVEMEIACTELDAAFRPEAVVGSENTESVADR